MLVLALSGARRSQERVLRSVLEVVLVVGIVSAVIRVRPVRVGVVVVVDGVMAMLVGPGRITLSWNA